MCEPTPARPIPVLVGGMTRPALRRAREHGDGWLGIQRADAIDIAALEAVAGQLDGVERRVLRVAGSSGRGHEIAAVLPALADAGITDVVVDVDWDGDLAAQAAVLLARA